MVGVVYQDSDKKNHECGQQANQCNQDVGVKLVDNRIRRRGIIHGSQLFFLPLPSEDSAQRRSAIAKIQWRNKLELCSRAW
jgi:hypothetical protein